MIYSEFINQTVSNNNEIQWNYYGNGLNINNILQASNSKNFIQGYFENGLKTLPMLINPESARNHINSYFTAARKEYALSFDFNEQHQLSDERSIHTVSTFFLGLLIENCLTGTNTLCIQSNNHFPFSYLWFLTCLYHDYGYCVTESDNISYPFPTTAPNACGYYQHNSGACSFQYRALNQAKKVLGIDLSLFQCFPYMFSSHYTEPLLERAILKELTLSHNKISKRNKLRFNTNSVVSSPQYDSLTIVRYFNYCINERSRVDHGIIGGLLFYDRMIKNYMLAYITATQECNYTPHLSDFEYRNRHFCSEQLIIFSYIADCILSHNIFKQPIDKRQLYEKYELKSLYSENFKKINFEDNPLLYILAIADSIEPTKIYCRDVSTPSIINAIDTEYIPASKKLEISCLSNDIDIHKIYSKAKELEDWTSAKCSDLHNNSFTLKL